MIKKRITIIYKNGVIREIDDNSETTVEKLILELSNIFKRDHIYNLTCDTKSIILRPKQLLSIEVDDISNETFDESIFDSSTNDIANDLVNTTTLTYELDPIEKELLDEPVVDNSDINTEQILDNTPVVDEPDEEDEEDEAYDDDNC